MHNAVTLGWDVGGAHLKAALLDSDGRVSRVFQKPCPLWRGMDHLERALAEVMAALGGARVRHAVTMTGELVDMFPSREEGVRRLTACLAQRLGADGVRVYAGPRGFVAPAEAESRAADVASANWHASAAFLAARAGDGLLVDIGSTTSDLILLHRGKPAARGYGDAERLRFEELVYAGVVRTPVMAVAQRLPFAGEWQALAAEHFATTADVYRLTGDLPEGCDMSDTADGAGKSLEESARRLARMVGRDLGDATMAQWGDLAQAVKSQQVRTLLAAVERALSRSLLPAGAPLVGAGAGCFLVRELARQARRAFVDAATLVPAEAEAAAWSGICLPACAVAWLAAREAA